MKIQLSSSDLQVGIYTKGAEVFSVQNNEGLEFMWQANPLYWPRHAPVLFPIVGRLKDNTYFIDQKKYTLPQHGFARDAFFEPVLMSASSCTLQLKAQDSMADQYPFDFVFEITHRLEGDTLHTQYTVINPTSKPFILALEPILPSTGPSIPLKKPKTITWLLKNPLTL
jgi:galactose mutarotase-like enzyme